ncbi:hypothetical protein BASA82_001188 [Batrachochytrium salamandrivorans]|nr:hypothetical protein BASA60_010397 [Batrachochytrium salamandrivorans]KAH6567343.1 hypothetical protein BASA62_006166 [Batrachochytrium salamandrivorans]KAH6578691.1 hypothetical protein BASA61_000156 [Batrachochytrium salamandrivorans]KAH9256769.1 hypothetical protein BASA81_005063 [Batrachochytrium salamandrivorans]KAH9259873.1 hypothetical protein BASA82_001188 [Batrachochytrium salamandrivorans]
MPIPIHLLQQQTSASNDYHAQEQPSSLLPSPDTASSTISCSTTNSITDYNNTSLLSPSSSPPPSLDNQSLLSPPASFGSLLRHPQSHNWSSSVSARSGASICSDSVSVDSARSMPSLFINRLSHRSSYQAPPTHPFLRQQMQSLNQTQMSSDLPPEILALQITLSNPTITFRGVNPGHLLDNDTTPLQGHVSVHFAQMPTALACVRLRIVGEELVRAYSSRSKISQPRGIFEHHVFLSRSIVLWEPSQEELLSTRSRELRFKINLLGEQCPPSFLSDEGSIAYRVEVVLDLNESAKENVKDGVVLCACMSDFQVQRIPTLAEMKLYTQSLMLSKLQITCLAAGPRIILAHQAGPSNLITVTPCRVSICIEGVPGLTIINRIIVSLVERTRLLGRKQSILAKIRPKFKAYIRNRNVLGAREISPDAIGSSILLDLYDISAADVLNQTTYGKHLEVTHHLAVAIHCNKRPYPVLMEIPIIVAFT